MKTIEEKADYHQERLIIAFVQGAKYWEFARTASTMWQSDQNKCSETAQAMLNSGTLGKSESEILAERAK